MTARRMFAALLALASLAGCTADQTNRAIYDGLRRREELIRPDVDNRRAQPTYDQYRDDRDGKLGRDNG